MKKKLLMSFVVVAALVSVTAIAIAAVSRTGKDHRGHQVLGTSLTAGEGPIRIHDSRVDEAVFSASNMAPGQTVNGSVTVGNPNTVPIFLSLAPKSPAVGPLASELQTTVVAGSGDSARTVYAGPLSDLPNVDLGTYSAGEYRSFNFSATLPRSLGNDAQGESAVVDLVWNATSTIPPPVCKVKAMRARFFIFRRLGVVRMVTRYESYAPGTVNVVFFRRLADGRRGPRIGRMVTNFTESPDQWVQKRIRRRKDDTVLKKLRSTPYGFYARLRVQGAPVNCARRLNLQLSDLRRVDRQFVWFQQGSFKRIR